jgi:hypothetical protein
MLLWVDTAVPLAYTPCEPACLLNPATSRLQADQVILADLNSELGQGLCNHLNGTNGY